MIACYFVPLDGVAGAIRIEKDSHGRERLRRMDPDRVEMSAVPVGDTAGVIPLEAHQVEGPAIESFQLGERHPERDAREHVPL